MGLTMPTSTDTRGYSVTHMEVYGYNTGLIAHGDVDAGTGSLNDLAELTQIQAIDQSLDIDFIMIMTECEYVDGLPDGAYPWDFEIEVAVSDPGTLHHIDVYTPGNVSSFLTLLEDEPNSWASDLGNYSSLAELQVEYPEGIYTFELHDSSNRLLKTVALDYSGLTAPSANVDFTYPSVNSQLNIDTNPTFTWTIPADAGDLLLPGVDDEGSDEQVYGGVPLPMTTQSWCPGPLSPNHNYQLDVTISKLLDWNGSDYPATTVGSDTFYTYLTFDYINSISFTTGEPSNHVADDDSDWEIGDFELLDYIDQWATGFVGDFELLDCIDLWAAGHYYWDENNGTFKPGSE